MVFAHGFGCDQNMWRYVTPAFEDDFKVVLFDPVGAGGSDISASPQKDIRRWTAMPTTSLRFVEA
jgi:sigma-B regulation protein RsbQ